MLPRFVVLDLSFVITKKSKCVPEKKQHNQKNLIFYQVNANVLAVFVVLTVFIVFVVWVVFVVNDNIIFL